MPSEKLSAILDSNVISLLADPLPRGKNKPIKRYYVEQSGEYSWYYTKTIERELSDILKRQGGRKLYDEIRALLASKGSRFLEWSDEMQNEFESSELARAFPRKSRSDIRDRRIAAASIVSGKPVITHDREFYRHSLSITGLSVVSWYGKPRKGVKTRKLGRKGRTR